VEDVVAIEVLLSDGTVRYFMTWGRIQHPDDPEPLARLVLEHAHAVVPEPARSARVCPSLRVAAESDAAPHFYECLLSFAGRPVPRGGLEYDRWRRDRASAMQAGQEISFCGHPRAEPSASAPAGSSIVLPTFAPRPPAEPPLPPKSPPFITPKPKPATALPNVASIGDLWREAAELAGLDVLDLPPGLGSE
jgi:hypothetical protein